MKEAFLYGPDEKKKILFGVVKDGKLSLAQWVKTKIRDELKLLGLSTVKDIMIDISKE